MEKFQMDDFIEILKSDLKTQKRALITEAMQFTTEESAVFWPIYKKYEYEHSHINDDRFHAIKDYSAHYEKMTDEKARELVHKFFSMDENEMSLKRKFFAEFDLKLSPITVAKFFQVYGQINMLFNLELASELPLIKKPN